MSFAFYVAFACITVVLGDQIVTINQGQLNGAILRSRDDKPFYAFYGIPYAAAPVGKLRFAAPKKPPSWEGIRNATQIAPICLQPSTFTSTNVSFVGDEDCLYLSVFTSQIKPDKLLPVLVYIHGGAFHMGSGDKSGTQFFMDKPIVVVTMNYRHGVFGFLSAADAVVPGNYGLKDQVAALRWVQSNVANFGGDPTSVTILGQSSGAVCVHLHTMSPRSKGLFHRAVMQSGSALSFWSHYNSRHSKRSFMDLVKRLNCQSNTTVEILSCLRNMSAEQLIRTEHSFLGEKRIIIKFRPAIEKRKVKNAFMTVTPTKLRYQNTSIPWIIGFNSAEAIIDTIMFLKKAGHGKKMTRELRRTLPYSLHYKYFENSAQISNTTAALMQFYFNNGTVGENDEQRICNLLSDVVFGMPVIHAAHSYPGPKYFYYFDFKNNISDRFSFLNSTQTSNIKGSGHGEEMFNLFSSNTNEKLIGADFENSRKIIDYWTNFVINGTPNSQNDHLPHWDQFEQETGNYLHIANDKITMQKQLLSERYAFWKTLAASSSQR